MNQKTDPKPALIDASRLIIESLVRAGADAYFGYPITPANLLYLYSSRRFPCMLPAPDEISAVQWMAGVSAAGYLPVTATSFPGLALMAEGINMAAMMELPMLIILGQRLGPSTGTATCNAQGDLGFLHGLISGGSQLPVFCPTCFEECWTLPPLALQTAWSLRSPVIFLTCKEMVMTQRSFDLSSLPPVPAVQRDQFEGEHYATYETREDLTRPWLPVGNNRHMVTLTASTHNQQGLIQHNSREAMANTRRLHDKVQRHLEKFVRYEHDRCKGAKHLLISYGITAHACREAVATLRARGKAVDLLIVNTVLPVFQDLARLTAPYHHIGVVEENYPGVYRKILFGEAERRGIYGINSLGHLVNPEDIILEVLDHGN